MTHFQLILRLGAAVIASLAKSETHAIAKEFWASYPETAQTSLLGQKHDWLVFDVSMDTSIKASCLEHFNAKCKLLYGSVTEALKDDGVLEALSLMLPEMAEQIADAYSKTFARMTDVICLTDKTVVFPHVEDTLCAAVDLIESDSSDLCGRIASLSPDQMEALMRRLNIDPASMAEVYHSRTHRLEPTYTVNSRGFVSKVLWWRLNTGGFARICQKSYPRSLDEQEKVSRALSETTIMLEAAVSAVMS